MCLMLQSKRYEEGMLIHSIFMPSNRFLWFTQCPNKIQNRGEKHVKIQSYNNLRTRYTPYYPRTLSGKVNIQWGIYQACEIVTNIRYAFLSKDLMHSCSLEKLQMVLNQRQPLIFEQTSSESLFFVPSLFLHFLSSAL